ncbi:hypothetical protein BDA96_04G135400 [Sorghum bicolor]|uniref:Uncharacterized protein n=2 Tax=Sorghum bicolor TaxID=4558 RepID=A0A921UK56_SORBI|nr:hypothetical protein BDA96_04G135400 [Sorghum bicolor]KXG30047.1 hypothetical protein SORBI_3004G127500 [Sorghum bicolor]
MLAEELVAHLNRHRCTTDFADATLVRHARAQARGGRGACPRMRRVHGFAAGQDKGARGSDPPGRRDGGGSGPRAANAKARVGHVSRISGCGLTQ